MKQTEGIVQYRYKGRQFDGSTVNMAVQFVKDRIYHALEIINGDERSYNHVLHVLDELSRDCIDFEIQESVTSLVLEAYVIFKRQHDDQIMTSNSNQYQTPVCLTGAIGRPRLDITEPQL